MEQQHQRLQESLELEVGKLENKLDSINVSLEKLVNNMTDSTAKQDLLIDGMVKFLSTAECQAHSQAQKASSFQQSAANSTLIANNLQLLVNLQLGRIPVATGSSATPNFPSNYHQSGTKNFYGRKTTSTRRRRSG